MPLLHRQETSICGSEKSFSMYNVGENAGVYLLALLFFLFELNNV
jgi:hypothetical protein